MKKHQSAKQSPMFEQAVRNGDEALLKKALSGGADPNQLVDGEHPLLNPILGFTETLVKAGADVNVKDKNGSTVLHLLCTTSQESSHKYESLLKEIARKSKSIDVQNSHGMTPLMVACKAGRLKTVRILLELGAKADLINKQTGHNALFDAITSSASSKDVTKIVQLLLEKKSQLEIHDTELGWTPLMSAVFMNRLDQVNLLLRGGADRRAKSLGINDYPVETALDIAIRMQYAEMVDLLSNAG